MSETLLAQPWRCLKSGNPVGTDTYQIGFSCQCQVCRADAEITSLRAQLAEARADHRTAIDHLLARTHLVNRKTEEIDRLQAALADARAAFEKILEHAKPRENDDDLLCIIAMIAENFLNPSKLASLKEGE